MHVDEDLNYKLPATFREQIKSPKKSGRKFTLEATNAEREMNQQNFGQLN